MLMIMIMMRRMMKRKMKRVIVRTVIGTMMMVQGKGSAVYYKRKVLSFTIVIAIILSTTIRIEIRAALTTTAAVFFL